MTTPVDEPRLFDRMRYLDDTERISYAERGRICHYVRVHLVHQQRTNPETGEPCSFTEWVRLAAPWSYQTCFAAMRDVEALSDIPAKELAQIPQANFAVLRQLSTAVRAQPAVIEAAKTQRSDKLIEHVQRNHPDQHIESKQTLRFVADESQAEEIEEAIGLAIERGAMNRTEALLSICIDYRAAVMLEDLAKEAT